MKVNAAGSAYDVTALRHRSPPIRGSGFYAHTVHPAAVRWLRAINEPKQKRFTPFEAAEHRSMLICSMTFLQLCLLA